MDKELWLLGILMAFQLFCAIVAVKIANNKRNLPHERDGDWLWPHFMFISILIIIWLVV